MVKKGDTHFFIRLRPNKDDPSSATLPIGIIGSQSMIFLTEETQEFALLVYGHIFGEHRGSQGRVGQPLQLVISFAFEQYFAHFLEQFEFLFDIDVVVTERVECKKILKLKNF